MSNKYFEGMIWLDWEYTIPKNPRESFDYIKQMRKPTATKMVEAMENSVMDWKAIDFEVPN